MLQARKGITFFTFRRRPPLGGTLLSKALCFSYVVYIYILL